MNPHNHKSYHQIELGAEVWAEIERIQLILWLMAANHYLHHHGHQCHGSHHHHQHHIQHHHGRHHDHGHPHPHLVGHHCPQNHCGHHFCHLGHHHHHGHCQYPHHHHHHAKNIDNSYDDELI